MNNIIRDVIFFLLYQEYILILFSCFPPLAPSFLSYVYQTPYQTILNAVFVSFRYLDKEGLVFNQFLDIMRVSDGESDTIVTAVKTVLQNKQVPTEKLCGLGTDGAAVMTGIIILLFHIGVFLRKKCIQFALLCYLTCQHRACKWGC